MIQRTESIQHRRHNEKEFLIDEGIMSEVAWQRWQARYAVRRRKTFIHILEAQREHLALLFGKNIAVISTTRDYYIELTHHESDPGMWIVRHWKKFLWFRRRISSDWFNDERQARAFGVEIQQKQEKRSVLRETKEIVRHAK
jgi:hypothetical protein